MRTKGFTSRFSWPKRSPSSISMPAADIWMGRSVGEGTQPPSSRRPRQTEGSSDLTATPQRSPSPDESSGASAICVDAVCSCPFVAAFDGALDGVDDVDADEDVP